MTTTPEMLEHHVQAPNSVIPWSERSPSVSMDIRLGGLGKILEFDIPSYTNFLHNKVAPRSHSDLHVHFEPEHSLAAGAYIDGPGEFPEGYEPSPLVAYPLEYVYKPPTRQIRLHVPPESELPNRGLGSDWSVNSTLLHETGHYKDDLEGSLMSKKEHARRVKISRLMPLIGWRIERLTNRSERYARRFQRRDIEKDYRFFRTARPK